MEEKSISATLKRFSHFRYRLVLEGICVGAAGGLVSVLFRAVLEHASSALLWVLPLLSEKPWLIPFWFLFLLLAAGAVTLLLKKEPLISGSGIPQVEGEMQGRLNAAWWRVLWAKFLGGLCTIGCGLALGREGPSIQLGAMAGKGVSRMTGRVRTEEKLLITCGASAGLAAAFNAPLAGVLFSLEELHKDFSLDVLLPAMSASITADFISRNVFGLKPVFDFSATASMPLYNYWIVLLLGAFLGGLGALQIRATGWLQDLYAKIKSPFLRTAIPFLLAGVLGLTFPSLLGGGHSLILSVGPELTAGVLAGLLLARLCFSLISFCSGVPGGIFLPLLVVGALSGGLFGRFFELLGLSGVFQDFVILGMAGYFAAVVRAPVTGIVLISEMTGSFSHLLTLSLVSLTAYAMADLLRTKPIYDQLLHRLLQKQTEPAPEAGEEHAVPDKVLVKATVHLGAAVCDKRIREVPWPKNCLVVSVERGDREFIPSGDTLLLGGDTVVLLCGEEDSFLAMEALEEQCKQLALV